jgi:hypothetical protein
MRIIVGLFMFASIVCLAPQRGFAASRQARERAAKKACLTGDPEKGVAILADLFIESDDLAYIFNQGRCFEQNRRYEDAVGRFREFLIKGKDLKADERAEAERHIAACQSYVVRTEPVEQPKVVSQPTSPPVQPTSVVFTPPPTTVTSTVKQPSGSDGSGLRITGITIGALGVAAVVTGVVLNLKANSMAGDLEKPESYSRSSDSTRKDYKTAAWVGYGAGAAFVAGGAVLYYLGRLNGQESASGLTVSPAVSSNMVGTTLTGAF